MGLVLIKAGQSQSGTKAYLITIGLLSVVFSGDRPHRRHIAMHQVPVSGTGGRGPFQISVTDLTSKQIRRIAFSHALMSYLFGALIVALAIK